MYYAANEISAGRLTNNGIKVVFRNPIGQDVYGLLFKTIRLKCAFCGGFGHEDSISGKRCPLVWKLRKEAKERGCSFALGALKGAYDPPSKDNLAEV